MTIPSVSGRDAASTIRKGTDAPPVDIHAKGNRECINCTFCHPERKKPCSAFGQLQNKDKDCSLYIPK